MAGTPFKVLILVLSVSYLLADSLLCSQHWNMTAVGYRHTLGIMANGSLYTWGLNSHDQLGIKIPYGTSQLTPAPVMPQVTFKYVASNTHLSFAITTGGKLFTWGWNEYGFLSASSPVQVGKDSDWRMVAVGDEHVLALKDNGTLYSWGKGKAIGTKGYFEEVPVLIMPEFTWKSISAGKKLSFAIRDDGALFSWGRNSAGQLGDGTGDSRELPTHIRKDITFSTVSAGDSHVLAIDTAGNLYSWGSNTKGQAGWAVAGYIVNPTIIESLKNSKWKAATAGHRYYSMAIREDGTLWGFGYNHAGQLGIGSKARQFKPIQVVGDQKWKSISGGDYHTVGITAEGQVIGWGSNEFGQLGDGTQTQENYLAPHYCPQNVENNQKTRLLSAAKGKIISYIMKELFKSRQQPSL